MPHCNYPIIAHVISLAILYSLISRIPKIESEVIQHTVERITEFDAQIPVFNFDKQKSMKQNNLNLNQKKQLKPTDLKLDLYMSTLLHYMKL